MKYFEIGKAYILPKEDTREIVEKLMNDKYLFYVGRDKGTLIGVPARDLSYEEAQKHGITSLLASGLYVYNSDGAIPKEYRSDLGLPEDEVKVKSKKRKKESE